MLAAVIANCHRDPKKGRAYRPGDFDPYGQAAGEVVHVDKDNIGLLKEAFLRQDGRKGF